MAARVLILGGTGRIGSSVAADLCSHNPYEVQIAGRNPRRGERLCQTLGPLAQFLALDLDDRVRLRTAIAAADLVIHCAGPFLQRDARVLQACIEMGTPYLDVSDSRDFTALALSLRDRAAEAGVTAVINSGIFPGISNSMVRQAAEQCDRPETIQLSYVVAGSGGAGLTVMRTTFLGLLHPFDVWRDRRWQPVLPYSDRQAVQFPHYGQAPVYWFDVPETLTLAESFPSVRSVATKFGSLPDGYNYLTWLVARSVPPKLLRQPAAIEFLSQVSYAMTQLSDRLTGIGVAMRADVTETRDGQVWRSTSTLYCEDTAAAAGAGTGSIAQLMLSEGRSKPGVWPVEQFLTTAMFETAMKNRQIPVQLEPLTAWTEKSADRASNQ